jgi:hypothetical protein
MLRMCGHYIGQSIAQLLSMHEMYIQSKRFIGHPSVPQNLRFIQTHTPNSDVTVRLDWDPPLNNGGVVITNYLISVNMSQQVLSTDTTTTFTLNSTGQSLIEVSAVNDCGFTSDDTSTTITIAGMYVAMNMHIKPPIDPSMQELTTPTTTGDDTSGTTVEISMIL